MIRTLLIANRGEIACRVIRTARRLGIRTVAVHSDADAQALHVREADQAVHIGPSPARESYLVGDRIVAAALATGAEAIHPGYGFLSENADFAQAVIDAGLTWVGPRPDSIRAMGLKDAAKARMIAAGVPVTPGYQGEDQSPDRLAREADAVGYPVLIKAVAGGGGKGMRRVDDPADFASALDSCRREAASSFGDDRVLIERYILSPRHIEVQVFGDAHGNIVHLFERDCSLQRRHQKVIEEAPAPGMDEATREAVCAAAVRAARAVDYQGAGTVEFIADAGEGLRADRIFFMEMNTRLQVEHPVTEEITGVDLVEWQLRVASGEPLPKRQDELSINGHAIEARLYAEDPANGFLPSTGELAVLKFPRHADHLDAAPARWIVTERGRVSGRDIIDWLRIDTGVEQGSVVSSFYDPMIAKVIAWQPDRAGALRHLAVALERTRVWPVRTNAGFLGRLLNDARVRAGNISTGLIADASYLTHKPPLSERAGLDAAKLLRHDTLRVLPPAPTGKGTFTGFRLNAAPVLRSVVYVDGTARSVDWAPDMDSIGGQWAKSDEQWIMFERGEAYRIAMDARGTVAGPAADGAILAPMPGRVTAVEVAAGAAVAKGQKLLTLEAMKMEHALTAPFDGTVAELNAATGGQVTEGALLVRVERAE